MNAIAADYAEVHVDAGIEPLNRVLAQLGELLRRTSDEQYTLKPVGVVNSSLGGHVRHCLDHVISLLGGATLGEMSYDDRHRGTSIETDRGAALRALEIVQDDLQSLCGMPLDTPIRLRALIAANGPSLHVESSLGRELAFVLSHTVHHNALIGVIAATLGITVPERFGYAPSTLAYMGSRPCAR